MNEGNGNQMPPSLDQSRLVEGLRETVGDRNLITRQDKKEPYCTGFRFGSGAALAVVLAALVLISVCRRHR